MKGVVLGNRDQFKLGQYSNTKKIIDLLVFKAIKTQAEF